MKYFFDINDGHYHIINEDDNNNSDNNTNNTTLNTELNNIEKIQGLPTLTSDDIVNAENEKNTKTNDFDNKIKQKNDNIIKLKEKLTNLIELFKKLSETNDSSASNIRTQIVQNNKNILLIENDIVKLEFDKATMLKNEQTKIIQLKLSINESYSNFNKLPEKYKFLNESNIGNAKVYMKNLIMNDDNHILKGMTDFKNAFAESNLLYGKDKQGYYIVAVDLEDFNRLYDTLEETGYLRDEIFDTIMPLLFDRKEMVLNNLN